MCCDAQKAPPADPGIAIAANRQMALAEKQYADYNAPGGDREWLRQTAQQYMDTAKKTSESAQAQSDYQLGNMKKNDDRYQSVAVPFEDQLLGDVKRFDSPDYKNQQVQSAAADVQAASDNVAGQRERDMERSGINPNSGRAAQMQTQLDLGKASAIAGATTRTRLAADQVGLSSKMSMYGGMKGLAGLGNANAGLAQSAMGTTLAAGGAGQNAAMGSINANNQNTASTISGIGAGVGGLSTATQLNQAATRINNESDPTAALLGGAMQAGAIIYGRR